MTATRPPRPPSRPVGEDDLLAYVDGRLDPRRRREVELHLLRHPADAVRVAADLAIQDGLRRLFRSSPPAG
ncbi:MAG: zf-HC2 domain-containing protein [Pseudomonadota bacterium]